MEIKLIDWNKLKINHCEEIHFDFFIGKNNVETKYLGDGVYSFSFEDEILGNELFIILDNTRYVVSNELAPEFNNFDDKYFSNEEFGAIYNNKSTTFRLWAPLAHKVLLCINNEKHELIRKSNGVFELTLNGDFDGTLYDYEVYRDDLVIKTIDPYGKSSNANGEKSAVIDFNKTKIEMNDSSLSIFNNYVEAIIYEGHVRDLTISAKTNITNKGKFLGLCEEDAKTIKNNPVGLSYLKKLGITHLQLLPVLDYGSVNETKDDEYNWGYDPVQFFTLEGSYSLNPNDPYSRIKEFKTLVSTLHKNNIRVNLDVVFNHVYKIEEFSLNKITPNYFARKENDKLSNRSWCGNDFASERLMARKVIIDSLLFLIKEYDVDGFRFDLMGLIDIETISLAEKEIHKVKKDAMIYGEGWDMFATSKYCEKFAHLKNANLLENVAFFNDSYRNIMRGVGSKAKLEENGFLLGNNSFNDGFEFAFRASTIDKVFPHLFSSFNQSINYIECHDNATIYDVIDKSTEEADKERLIKLFNKVLLLSPGITFVHMGQEFGQSKRGESNTYNLGDGYNAFDVDRYDNNTNLVESFVNYVKIRKSISLFKNPNVDEVNSNIHICVDKDVTDINMKDKIIFHIIINKDASFKPLNELKYTKMELYKMDESLFPGEKIVASSIGIGPNKCSVFKES